MKDRSQTIDLLLVFAAAFVITLSWWPKDKPRQVVRCNTPQTGWGTYSIALDDPSLADLQQRLDEWSKLESDSSFLAAKWEKETAEFYLADSQQLTSKPAVGPAPKEDGIGAVTLVGPATIQLSDTIATASYETPIINLPPSDVEVDPESGSQTTDNFALPTHAGDEIASKPESDQSASDREHWQNVLAKANSVIASTKKSKANPPVVIEGRTGAGWPPLAFHLAFLLGICGACGYMHWNKRAPLRRGMEFRDQPTTVLARIGTYCGVVGLAMLSALAIWI